MERRRAASKPVAFNASPNSVSYANSDCLTNFECPAPPLEERNFYIRTRTERKLRQCKTFEFTLQYKSLSPQLLYMDDEIFDGLRFDQFSLSLKVSSHVVRTASHEIIA